MGPGLYGVLVLIFAGLASSADLYIQDLPQYSQLVPCAASAITGPVNGLTSSLCPDSPEGLQSCACTKDSNSANVLDKISTTIGYSCGSNAVEDLESATALFGLYCNPAATTTIATSTPNPNAVSDYIWDLSAYSDLAPCASSALKYAVGRMTSSLCHDDPSGLASCVCTKNQNSRFVSSEIKTNIGYSCGSSVTADLTSALAVWDGYCKLGDGTSSFPPRSPLPGLVSYYIWDLPQFSSLVPCAQSALQYEVKQQTTNLCPQGPRELVSCLCAKDNKSQVISRELVTTVGYSCGTDAKADVTSAQAVFAYYCSAGKGLVTAEGITVSAETTSGGNNGVGGGESSRTSSGSGEFPSETSSSTSSSSSSASGVSGGKSSGKAPIGAIAGGVVGGAAVLILAALAFWRYRRNRNKPPHGIPAESGYPHQPYDHSKPELGATVTATIPVNSPIPRKPAPSAVYHKLPVSPIDDKSPAAEMQSPPAPYRSEVPGGPYAQEMSNERPYHEVYGSQQHPVELSGPRANMNDGPFFEMDGRRYRH